MSAEFLDKTEEHEPSHLEFYLVMAALKSKFEQAKQEQLETKRYDMFTLLGRQVGIFARIRIADQTLVRESLQAVSVSEEDYFDVGMPLAQADVESPELARGRDGHRFLLFSRSEGQETETLIDVSNIHEFLQLHPDFVHQSLAYEPIPLRKTEA